MNIANCNGDFECQSGDELENLIKKSSLNPFDDIWLNGSADYPCLSILINGSYACVHYFLNDEGDVWQSIGHDDKDVTFVSNGDRSDLPADCIISLDRAVECARQFYDTLDRPTCIEWREL